MPPYEELAAPVSYGLVSETTPYARFGDWFVWSCLAIGVGLGIWSMRHFPIGMYVYWHGCQLKILTDPLDSIRAPCTQAMIRTRRHMPAQYRSISQPLSLSKTLNTRRDLFALKQFGNIYTPHYESDDRRAGRAGGFA